jgi:hypothetical protein
VISDDTSLRTIACDLLVSRLGFCAGGRSSDPEDMQTVLLTILNDMEFHLQSNKSPGTLPVYFMMTLIW